MKEQDIFHLMDTYKAHVIENAALNQLSPRFVGLCLLEIAIPMLSIEIADEEILAMLEDTKKNMQDPAMVESMESDVKEIKNIYKVILDEPAGSA